jgi:hypothetical protein
VHLIIAPVVCFPLVIFSNRSKRYAASLEAAMAKLNEQKQQQAQMFKSPVNFENQYQEQLISV